MQSIWRGNGFPSAGCTLDGRIIHLSRAARCLLAVPYGMFSIHTTGKVAPTYHFSPQMSFLSPPSLRHIIAVPRQDKVDFRAACFCHKNIVDIGFVCSVCLSSEFVSIFSGAALILIPWRSILFPSTRLLDLQVRYRGRCFAPSALLTLSLFRTKFPMKTLQRLNTSRPSLPPSNGVSNGSPRPPSARPNPGMSASLR